MPSSQLSCLRRTYPHRALGCYHILISVFEQLTAAQNSWYDHDTTLTWYHRQDCTQRRTLARCVGVCKAFLAPATAVLWRNVDSITPLLSIFHRHVQDTSLPSQVFAPDPRAFECAGQVRAVYGFEKRTWPSHHDFLAAIRAVDTNGQPLLPQLRHLRWIQAVPSGYELLQLIPPSLHSLHIIFRRSPDWSEHVVGTHSPSQYELFVRDLLSQVVSRAPRLRYLRVSTPGDVQESWLEHMGGFSELETVVVNERIFCEVTTSPLIQSLASLQHLLHLKLRLPAELPSCNTANEFSALQTLTLDATFAPLSVVATFLSLITSNTLHSLLLQHCECATSALPVILHDVCTIIRAHFRSCLRELELSLRAIGPEMTAKKQTLVHAIGPLLDLHDLEDVRLSVAPEVAVVPASDDDLWEMAEAWPKAKRLHLGYFHFTATPSLLVIVEFSRRCVGLRDFVLPAIEASMCEGAEGGETGTTLTLEPVRGLKSFGLSDAGWNSWIPDPARLAEVLNELFPEAEWTCPVHASSGWRATVEELIRLRGIKSF